MQLLLSYLVRQFNGTNRNILRIADEITGADSPMYALQLTL